jgi:predicted MFS family arabinose efflux permease
LRRSSDGVIVQGVNVSAAARRAALEYVRLPRPVHVLCLGTFVNRAGTMLVPFLTLYLTGERGFGIDFATLTLGVFGAGSMTGSLLGGQLADRLGRRPVMLVSLLGSAAVLGVFGTLTAWWSILAGVLVFAVLADMYRPAAAAMIADLVEPDVRPQAYGLMHVVLNLGMSLGAVIGGVLASIDFEWLFWVDALTTAGFALIVFAFIAETSLPSASEGFEPEAGVGLRETVAQVLGDRTFLVFCLGGLFVGLVFMQLMSTLPIDLKSHGIGPDGYGRLVALNCVLVVLLMLPLASLLSRFDRATVMVAAALFTGAGFGSIAFGSTAWHFSLSVGVLTIGELMSVPFASAIVTDLAPPRYRARYMGVFHLSFSSALMLGAPLGGVVLAHLGGAWLWGGAFAMGCVSAVLYLSVHRGMSDSRAG